MTREDVREYLLERLTTIVHDAKIDYVKWDMNRSVCDVYAMWQHRAETESCITAMCSVFTICWKNSLPHARICCSRAAAEEAEDMMPA